MKSTPIKFLKVLVYLSFLVPLAVFPSEYILSNFIFPFVVPKVLLFRTIVMLMIIPYAFLLYSYRKEFRPSSHPLHYMVLLYFIGLFVSTVSGVDFASSFWDTHERMLGFFTLIHYAVYYFILSSVFKQKEEWKNFQWGFLIAGVVVMLVGLYQRIAPDYLLNQGSWRVASTLGNPIYVGGYGLFLTYLGYLIGMQENIPWKKYLAWSGAFLGIVGVFISGTRGTMLGLFFSIAVLLGVYLLCLKGHKKIRSAIVALFGLGIIVLGILFAYRTTPVVQNIPSLGRLLNSSLTGDSAGTRLIAWKIAYQGWKDLPIFGWGPNNYYYTFNQYYNPASLYYGAGETWFDNAHNVLMNTLATGGIVGILAYLAIYGAAGFLLVRGYRQKMIDVHFLAVGFAFLAGHLIHNIFVFENVTSYLYFFFFLAAIAALTTERQEFKEKARTIPLSVKVGLTVVVVGIIYYTDIRVGQANHATLNAVRSIYSGQVETGFMHYEEAKKLSSPHIADIRSDFVRAAAQLVEHAYRNGQTSKEMQNFLNKVYLEQQATRQERPLDIRVQLLLSQVAMLQYYLEKDVTKLDEAEALLQEAKKISPFRQQLNFSLAIIKTFRGQTEEALVLYREAVEWEPRAGESWIKLGLATFAQTEKTEDAVKIFEEGVQRGALFTPQHLQTMKEFFDYTPSP